MGNFSFFSKSQSVAGDEKERRLHSPRLSRIELATTRGPLSLLNDTILNDTILSDPSVQAWAFPCPPRAGFPSF